MNTHNYYKYSKYITAACGILLAVIIFLDSVEVILPKPLLYIFIGITAFFIVAGIVFLIRFFPHEMRRQQEELKRKEEERKALEKELREKYKNVDLSKEPDIIYIKEPFDDDGFIPMG